MRVKQIQELLYDGEKLSCPDHPDQLIETGKTLSDQGIFTKVCMASTGGGACMKSAQWQNEEAMHNELKSLSQT